MCVIEEPLPKVSFKHMAANMAREVNRSSSLSHKVDCSTGMPADSAPIFTSNYDLADFPARPYFIWPTPAQNSTTASARAGSGVAFKGESMDTVDAKWYTDDNNESLSNQAASSHEVISDFPPIVPVSNTEPINPKKRKPRKLARFDSEQAMQLFLHSNLVTSDSE